MVKGKGVNPFLLQPIFGITSVSPAYEVERAPGPIVQTAVEVAQTQWAKLLQVSPSVRRFRVTASRSDKRFPLNSMDIEREVGSAILKNLPNLKVDLKSFDLEIGVEVRPHAGYVFSDRIIGQRGLPVGVNRKLLALISGGIDSPVSAWMMMKRGCPISFLHFHAPPYTSPAARQKVVELVTALKPYQGYATLILVPFAQIQEAIKEISPEKFRTLLYRRMMHRIAERLCETEGAQGIVTGDALGQVSSQTVENLLVIGEGLSLPLFQPLIGMDKVEIIERARSIGTFDLSIQPAADCCTLFTPKRPAVRADLSSIHHVETKLDLNLLITEAVGNTERVQL